MPWNSSLKESWFSKCFPKGQGLNARQQPSSRQGLHLRAPFLMCQGLVFALAPIGLWGPPIAVDGREYGGLFPAAQNDPAQALKHHPKPV